MVLSIKDFHTEMRSLGVQRSNRFLVDIGVPRSLDVTGSLMSLIGNPGGLLGTIADGVGSLVSISEERQMSLRCTNASFPGMQAMTKDDILRYGRGPVDKTVHNMLFSDIHCSFVVDAKGIIQNHFYRWMQSMVNTDSSGSMNSSVKGALPYEVSYKDDYITRMKITQLNNRNRPVIECQAHKVFPVSVGELQFGWEQTDQIVTLPVTFSYRDHKIVTL
jgi:hypothetical protein